MNGFRVSIIGTSCSGKTTLARRISSQFKIPHVELDELFWQPGWTPLPLDQFRATVAAAVAGDQWVIDGNYSKVRDIVWARATDVVWMNLPFAVILWRTIKRTTRRIITKEELFAGNQETIAKSLFARDSLLWWVIRTHRRRTRALRALLDGENQLPFSVYEVRNGTDAANTLKRLAYPS